MIGLWEPVSAKAPLDTPNLCSVNMFAYTQIEKTTTSKLLLIMPKIIQNTKGTYKGLIGDL